MTDLQILQKAFYLLSYRHIQLGILETSEKDEALRGYCICGAILKAVDYKLPVGPLVTRLSKMACAYADDTIGDLSEFSENYPTKDVLDFMYNTISVFMQEEMDAKANPS